MIPDMMMGARSRLLPPSIPFRFFGAALVFHAAAWAVLAYGADGLPGFMGGPGPVLAALHLVTLGVLAMTGMGAAYQLLPVATKRPVLSRRLCTATLWSFAPGVALLGHGLGTGQIWAMHGGATLVVVGLALFAVLVVDNLRRTGDMPLVTGHSWLAAASLATLVGLAVLLLANLGGGFLENRLSLAAAHAVVAGYGFMGQLAFGFSAILIPMFALGEAPRGRLGGWSIGLSGLALAVVVAGGALGRAEVMAAGGVVGLVAVALHLELMRRVLATRMKRSLGDAFVLIRLAWGLLPLSILAGLWLALGDRPEVAAPLFGLLLVFGWLLTFLTGVLQRIMPFLASMHSMVPGGRPALVSALTATRPLRVHLVCHGLALALVAGGIVAGQGWLVRLGALAGLAGALALVAFGVALRRRLLAHLALPPRSTKENPRP